MKLLICDDDISTIDVIQSQLNFRELGIDTLLRAYNGEAAIEIIDRENPELVLCDIGMPKVNGIEVLKHTYASNIYCEFAFLTCFEDFEYAREAVRYGATNYLTKPVDYDELTDALHKMVDAVNEHIAQSEKLLDSTATDSHVNNVLRQALDGFFGSNHKRVAQALKHNGITDFDADTPIRLVFIYGDISDAISDGWDRELLTYSFGRLAEESLTDYVGNRSTVVSIRDQYISASTFVRTDKFSEDASVISARQFARLALINFSINPVTLIGDEIPFYKAAEKAAEMRTEMKKILMQAGSVLRLSEVKAMTDAPQSVIDEEALLRHIKNQNKSGFLDTISAAVEKIVYSRKNSTSMMALLQKDILQAVYSCLSDNGIPTKVIFQSEEMRELDQKAFMSAHGMMSFASLLFDRTVSELNRSSESTDLIGVVKRYIQAHYKEDIDRGTLASVAHITPNYLSKRFRSETGMSLREYINELRIEEAKRLLISTNSTISEVASEVGYDNISYFSTVFRKTCGMSPIEWCGGKRSEDSKE